MKTRSKTLVCLLLGVMMLLSLIGAGVFAMAEDVVGKQASFPAEAFDTNGWLTTEYFNALDDKTGVIAAGDAAVTRHPEAATGGYTYINAHSQQKYLNYNKFEIGDEIALEYLMELSPAVNGHGPRLFHLVDSASADGYLGLSESKTKFALFF